MWATSALGRQGPLGKIVLDPELTKGKRGGVAYLSARTEGWPSAGKRRNLSVVLRHRTECP
jgi:hypothetical protein